MGLFDNLFKTKPDAADEAVVEAAKRIAEHEKARLLEAAKITPVTPAARSGIVPTLKPGSVPLAHAYSPRSLGQVVPPGRASAALPKQADSTPAFPRRVWLPAHDEPEPPSEVVLTIEDVLPRIPIDLINEHPHDLSRELRFKVEDLSADIARGRAAVSLARIAEQVPELFREPIAPDDPRQVRLPLQKLVEQIGFLPSKVAQTAEPLDAPPWPPRPGPGPALPLAQPLPPESSMPLSNARISLSLATVLRACPRDLIVAELPPIPDHARISFPWDPIERQLSSGQVEVSSVRFIFALPAYLQGYFEAREGIRVSLPLDEVRNNIPTQTSPPSPVFEAAPQSESTPAVDSPLPSPIIDELASPLSVPEPPSAPEVLFAGAEPAGVDELTTALSEFAASITAPPEPAVTSALEAPPLDLLPPLAVELAPHESEPAQAALETEVPVIPVTPPQTSTPPPLLPTGDTAPRSASDSPLAPPNVWMQPPAEITVRQVTQWPPVIAPPPSPLLPVRIFAPPAVRLFVAPPPLFGGAISETHIEPAVTALVAEPVTAEPVATAPAVIAPTAVEAAPSQPPRPLDLEVARAAFGMEGAATLADIGAALTRLPGMAACLLIVRHESAHAGEFPTAFDADAVRTLARQFAHALEGSAGKLGVGNVHHVTLFADGPCVSFFTEGEATVCAIHRARAFLPGVREGLAAAATALAHA